MQPRFAPIQCREHVEAKSRDPMTSQELATEVRSVCDALWDEVSTKPPESSASDEVLRNLAKLQSLCSVREKPDGPTRDFSKFIKSMLGPNVQLGYEGRLVSMQPTGALAESYDVMHDHAAGCLSQMSI